MNIKSTIKAIAEGEVLDASESEALFDAIFEGRVSDVELAAVLIAMKVRKETPDEIVGAVRSMRKYSLKPVLGNKELFDTCGTGGDNSHSFNISTAVAIILNALGISIAKHGNRSVSSRSGSADFLEALNIPISLSGSDAESYFSKHNFIFLFAPVYHPAMKEAMPVRKLLGVRTIFNYLGPLTNPCLPKRQIIGVFHPEFLPLYSEAVAQLPFERVLLYSADNGMDEVSPVNRTNVHDVRGESITSFTIDPEKFITPDEAGSIPTDYSASENAGIFMETVNSNKTTPLGKLLALNTALAMYAVDDNSSMDENYSKAMDMIISGEVYSKVVSLQEKSR